MTYTTVAAVVAGNKITATWGNSVAAAVGELQTAVPELSTTWSPTWTNLTVGNGTQTAKYVRIGDMLVAATLGLTWGSTTSISGSVSITLPINKASTVPAIGRCLYFDNGTDSHGGIIRAGVGATTTASLFVDKVNGASYGDYDSLTSTAPFTWTTGDIIEFNLIYLVA